MEDKMLYTLTDVAATLSVGRSKVYELVRSGEPSPSALCWDDFAARHAATVWVANINHRFRRPLANTARRQIAA